MIGEDAEVDEIRETPEAYETRKQLNEMWATVLKRWEKNGRTQAGFIAFRLGELLGELLKEAKD